MKKRLAILLASCASLAAADFNPYSAESAIYRVEVPYKDSNQIGFGTGVLIATDKILTNCHVVKNHPGWPRVIHRKTGQKFEISKYYNLGDYDACVLVGRFSGTPVQLAPDIREGENIWIYGYPADLSIMGQGAVKGFVDTGNGKYLLLGAFCAPGSSGGPVLNAKGQLVGLNWGTFRYQNQCLCIPASFLRPYLTGI